jgi:hypothetical protein
MRSVTIDECTEGYLVKDGITFKTFAVSKDKLVQKVKELLGITDKKTEKPKDRIDILRDAAKEIIKANPNPFISDSSNSTFPKYNKLPSGSEITKELAPAINQSGIKPMPAHAFAFTEIAAFEVSVQPVTAGKSIYWLHPGGKKIKISRVGYLSVFIYTNISDLKYLYDHPSEQKDILRAYGKVTYVNKAVILRGFLKDVPLSAIISYTNNDGVFGGKEEPSCDDIVFESCINGYTAKDDNIAKNNCKFCIDQSRYENKNKLAAKKPAPPLMKAIIPP